MAHTSPEPAAAEPIIVAHAAEDAVWGMWLQQVGTDAGLDMKLLRVDPGDGLPPADAGRISALVISDSFMRATGAAAEDWARYGSEPAGVLAVIVATADVPPVAERIAAVDLRLLPGENAARAKVLRAFGRPDGAITAPETLGRAARMRVRYPNEQMFVDYQTKTLPPHRPDWFYGREPELAAIRDGLDKTGAAVLTGVAGSGKSWLAAAYVRRFRSQYDLIAWISGENGALMRTELAQLAEPLGLPESPNRGTQHKDVVDELRRTGKRYLLVYDNVTPDHHRTGREQLPLPRKPALLSEMVPWDGIGHVLLTSKVSDWSSPQPIRVPMFTVGEGADFLRRHIGDLPEELARRFSTALDGSPVLLNALAHRGARGIEPVDEALLRQVQPAPFMVLNDDMARSYRRAASIIGDSLRPLLDEPVGSDPWAAGELLRLLACFAPGQSISMALLTSQLPGSERRAGLRLPEPLAEALANEHRRRNVLDLAVRDSVAEICVDPLTDRGRALRIHTVPWHGIHDFLPKDLAETNRHITHQVLCDADPQRTDLPALWGRYLWLWQQITHTEVLSCDRVAQPGDPCAQLPELVRRVVAALRVQGELTAAAGLGLRAAEAWSKLLGETDIGVVRIRIVTGNALWEMGDLDRARHAAIEARDGVEQVRASYPEEYIWSSDLIAACLRMAGDWAAAVEFNEQSHAWALECLGDSSIETVRAAHNLAVSYRVMGRFADAMRIDSANYERFQNDPMLAESSIMRLHCVNNVARNYRELGRAATSVVLQEQVSADFLKLLGSPRQQHVLRARKNLGVSYRKAGRYEEALETQRGVLTNHLRVYGADHPEAIAAETNVANDYRVLGDTEHAVEHAEAAYRRCANGYPDHPYTAACAVNYAAALRTAGRYQEALALDQEADAVFTRRLSEEHPYTLAARSGVASDLAGLNKAAEAVELGTDVLARCRRIRGADHPYTLQTAVNLGLDLRTLGRTEEADALETDTLERYFETLGDDHPEYQAARARRRGTCDVEPPPM
ncbi:FxSxx-COOH system tetratricopeptide repeat protein [Nocardia sp. NPDC019395]|uniref:FxSxx-COOH system tetratricopeptide repeat protein n=1 Tax=Nocardia sp. NPDC019395 TaxID=3154686 RepID=UPI0033CFEBCE